MQLKTILAGVLVTASYIVPFAEAGPIAAGIAMAATAIGGPFVGSLASIASRDKRELPEGSSGFQVVPRDGEFNGVNKHDVQRCRDSAKDMDMQVTQQSKSKLHLKGVSPACMTLAAYFTDDTAPYPCGNDCLQYDNLNDDQMKKLLDLARNNLKPGAKVT